MSNLEPLTTVAILSIPTASESDLQAAPVPSRSTHSAATNQVLSTGLDFSSINAATEVFEVASQTLSDKGPRMLDNFKEVEWAAMWEAARIVSLHPLLSTPEHIARVVNGSKSLASRWAVGSAKLTMMKADEIQLWWLPWGWIYAMTSTICGEFHKMVSLLCFIHAPSQQSSQHPHLERVELDDINTFESVYVNQQRVSHSFPCMPFS